MDYAKLFEAFKEQSLSGRYITLDHIAPLLKRRQQSVKIIGQSVNHKPLLAYFAGFGKTRVLLWSQMHGNESTATKALFDVFNLLDADSEFPKKLLSEFTFCFVPMLNPDGALAYTRENASGIDLNRDFHNLSQPESRALAELFESFEPDYCYNLHDQRTIFGAGDNGLPATISFLAPAYNHAREVNATRKTAIDVIIAMNKVLQELIPGQVGRFDDTFNINCAGDNFQFRGAPTILIEAGHHQGDYQREQTRFYFFAALLAGFQRIYENDIVHTDIDDYLNIPQNKTVFFDFVYKNVKINYDGIEKIANFAAQYKEELEGNSIVFNAYIEKVGDLENQFGHVEYDVENNNFSGESGNIPEIGQKANFTIGNDVKFVNGLKKM